MWITVSRVELFYSSWLKARYLLRWEQKEVKSESVEELPFSLLSADLQFRSFHSVSSGFGMGWGEELKE